MNYIDNLDKIDRPVPLDGIDAHVFDGRKYDGKWAEIAIENGLIVDKKIDGNVLQPPRSCLVVPGYVNLHDHGRDCFDVLPGEEGDQTYKEDSYTLSLALAQGGATSGMCMPNLKLDITTAVNYLRQKEWINQDQPHRKGPILPLEQYVLIKKGTRPIHIDTGVRAMYKLMWNTFGPANLENDGQVREVLSAYATPDNETRPGSPQFGGIWITAHCETIEGMVNDKTLPHHEQRPKQAAIDAVKLFLACAKEFKFHAHVAHISSSEEVELVAQYNAENNRRGLYATCEVTPQALTLNVDNFTWDTGLPLKWSQQNPPIRTEADMYALRNDVKDKRIHIFATDHAPHTPAEKEKGMSGMTQAPTAGQAYLEQVTKGTLSLDDFVRMTATTPGEILETQLGVTRGKIAPGYDASFTLVSMNKPSRITNADVLSKCSWTPYNQFQWSNTIEGVVINGILYTQKALQRLGHERRLADALKRK